MTTGFWVTAHPTIPGDLIGPAIEISLVSAMFAPKAGMG
jgi:hypothetical protein